MRKRRSRVRGPFLTRFGSGWGPGSGQGQGLLYQLMATASQFDSVRRFLPSMRGATSPTGNTSYFEVLVIVNGPNNANEQ